MRGTASKAALLEHCVWWTRDEAEWDEGPKTVYATNGDVFHAALAEYVLDGAVPQKMSTWLAPRWKAGVEWCQRNEVDAKRWRVEESYAYHVADRTARVLGQMLGRKYNHGPGEVVGTADLVCLRGDTVHVYDYKTGRSITDSVWGQMGWLSLFAARALGAWHAKAIVLHVTDHGIVETERDFPDVELAKVAESIEGYIKARDDAWPQHGSHCDAMWCPARKGCGVYQLRKQKVA